MVDLASLVRVASFPGVSLAPASISTGLRGWIREGSTAPLTANDSSATLQYFDEQELAGALAFDANTFATKALESIDAISILGLFPKAAAWAAIKLYYAAFFSSGFLMRICGRGTMYLERSESRDLRSIFNSYGIATELRGGAYYVTTTVSSHELMLSHAPEGLGTHEAAWAGFQEFLILLETSVSGALADAAERAGMRASLQALRRVLQTNGCLRGNWLSQERNMIQYRLHDRLWYPYRNGHRLEILLRKLIHCDVELGPERLNQPNHDALFFAACSFIVGWAIGVMDDIAGRSGGSNTVFKMGIQSYRARSGVPHLSAH